MWYKSVELMDLPSVYHEYSPRLDFDKYSPRPEANNFIGQECQFITFWRWILLRSMIVTSNSKVFVQSTSLPENLKLKLFSCKIYPVSRMVIAPENYSVRQHFSGEIVIREIG